MDDPFTAFHGQPPKWAFVEICLKLSFDLATLSKSCFGMTLDIGKGLALIFGTRQTQKSSRACSVWKQKLIRALGLMPTIVLDPIAYTRLPSVLLLHCFCLQREALKLVLTLVCQYTMLLALAQTC